MNRNILVALGAIAIVSVGGCGQKATGQVVAVVNGEEISLSDLNSEVQQLNLPEGADKKAATAAALQQLIDRKLLVQRAKSRNLDKDPAYLRQQRRMNDELLIGLLGKQVSGTVPVPSQTAITKFIADNPGMFSQRTIYALDQIQFALPADRTILKQLEPAKDMPAVMAVLDRLGIKYQHKDASFDSAQTPPELLTKVTSLPPGEPFVLAASGRVIVSVITGKKLMPLGDADSRALANEAMRRKSMTELAQGQLKDARTGAKIEYQPGYEPPAAPAGTPGAAPKQ